MLLHFREIYRGLEVLLIICGDGAHVGISWTPSTPFLPPGDLMQLHYRDTKGTSEIIFGMLRVPHTMYVFPCLFPTQVWGL